VERFSLGIIAIDGNFHYYAEIFEAVTLIPHQVTRIKYSKSS
jgi:hypothetical protein